MKGLKTKLLIAFATVLVIPTHAESVKDQISKMDIDLQIRSNEDPSFDQYLLRHQRQLALAKKASVASKARRVKDRAAYEESRARFSAAQKRKRLQELKLYALQKKNYEKKRARTISREDRNRKKFASQRKVIKQKVKMRRQLLIAKMQSRLSRLPASMGVMQRPRTHKSKRENLHKKILRDNQTRKR